MRTSQPTEAQSIGMIKEHEVGMVTAEVCRRHRSARRRSTSSRLSMAAWTCPMHKG